MRIGVLIGVHQRLGHCCRSCGLPCCSCTKIITHFASIESLYRDLSQSDCMDTHLSCCVLRGLCAWGGHCPWRSWCWNWLSDGFFCESHCGASLRVLQGRLCSLQLRVHSHFRACTTDQSFQRMVQRPILYTFTVHRSFAV